MGIHRGIGIIFELRERVVPRFRALVIFLAKGIRFERVGVHAKIQGAHKMVIGRGVALGDFCWIEAVVRYRRRNYDPVLSIGDNVSISDLTHISCVENISIGAGSLLGSKVYIGDHSHGSLRDYAAMQHLAPGDRPLGDAEEIVIGERVWIGDGCVILAGTKIAAGSILGANSVVRLRVDRPALIAGVPARVLRYFDEEAD